MVRCAYRTKEDAVAVELTDEQWAVILLRGIGDARSGRA
jgi:hypothetical protein